MPTTVKIAGTPQANEWHSVETFAGVIVQQQQLSDVDGGFRFDEEKVDEGEDRDARYHKNVLTVHHEDIELPKK